MTKQEKITHTALLNQISQLKIQVHKLSCMLGDYADSVCELKCCLEKGEPLNQWAISTLISTYLKHKEN